MNKNKNELEEKRRLLIEFLKEEHYLIPTTDDEIDRLFDEVMQEGKIDLPKSLKNAASEIRKRAGYQSKTNEDAGSTFKQGSDSGSPSFSFNLKRTFS